MELLELGALVGIAGGTTLNSVLASPGNSPNRSPASIGSSSRMGPGSPNSSPHSSDLTLLSSARSRIRSADVSDGTGL